MGHIIAINGLAGAGKTTTAKALYNKLRELQANNKLKCNGVIYFDGDNIRDIFDFYGYDKKSRCKLEEKKIKFCTAIAKQDSLIIYASISLFKECYEQNIKITKEAGIKYIQIFIDCPMSVLEQRDQKGLYSGAKADKIKEVVGVDIAYDKPNPDIVLDGTNSIEDNVNIILEYLTKNHKELIR